MHKVNYSETTTGTSSTINYRPPTEYGWVCPCCNRVNAPWKSSCDCQGYNWYPTWYPWDYKEPWWKQVTYEPTTTTDWKTKSTTSDTKSNPDTTTYTTAQNITVGGSDYWDSTKKEWTNVLNSQSNCTINNPWDTITDSLNKLKYEIDEIKENK